MTHTIIIDRHGNRRIAEAGEILQDGERVHVPSLFMDGSPQLLHDGMGNAAGHKPGYAFASGPAARVADAALDAARREYDATLTDAWRSPASKHAARMSQMPARTRMPPTRRGSPARGGRHDAYHARRPLSTSASPPLSTRASGRPTWPI